MSDTKKFPAIGLLVVFGVGSAAAAVSLTGFGWLMVKQGLTQEAADLVYIIFCRQIDVVLRDFQAGRTQLDLTDGLFARDIQHRVLVGDGTAELQQHGGLADTRLTTQQNHAAQYDTAAQHPVKL